MNASRGVKRKRGLARPLQEKVDIPLDLSTHLLSLRTSPDFRPSSPPNKFFPVNLYASVSFVEKEKGTNVTLPWKHHSLQEFKRLAKQAKVNETQIIVKKLKSLRSSTDKPGTATHNPANTVQDLEAQLAALKVRVACLEKNSDFFITCRL